jgi:hypothetical protein
MKKLTAIILTIVMLLNITACSDRQYSYEQAEREFLNAFLFGQSRTIFDVFTLDEGGVVTVTYTPEEYMLDIFENAGLYNVKPTTLTFAAAAQDDCIYSRILYNNGHKDFLSADLWLDASELLMSIPRVTDNYFFSDFAGFSYQLQQLRQIPTGDDLQKIIDEVLSAYFKTVIRDSEIQQGVNVTAGNMSVTATVTEIKLDAKTLCELMLEILQAIGDNTDSREINDILREGRGYVRYILDDIRDGQIRNSTVISMKVGISGSDIVSREISLRNPEDNSRLMSMSMTELSSKNAHEKDYSVKSDDGSFAISYTDSSDGSKFERRVTIREHGESIMTVRDEGTIDKGAISGSARLTTHYSHHEYELRLDYNDVTFDKYGHLNGGEFTLRPDEHTTFRLNVADNSLRGGVSFGGVRVATVEIKWEHGYDFEQKPNPGSNNIYNLNYDNLSHIDNIFEQLADELRENPDFFTVMLLGLADDGYNYDSSDPYHDYYNYEVSRTSVMPLLYLPAVIFTPVSGGGLWVAVGAAILIPIMMNYTTSSNCSMELANAKHAHNIAAEYVVTQISRNETVSHDEVNNLVREQFPMAIVDLEDNFFDYNIIVTIGYHGYASDFGSFNIVYCRCSPEYRDYYNRLY